MIVAFVWSTKTSFQLLFAVTLNVSIVCPEWAAVATWLVAISTLRRSIHEIPSATIYTWPLTGGLNNFGRASKLKVGRRKQPSHLLLKVDQKQLQARNTEWKSFFCQQIIRVTAFYQLIQIRFETCAALKKSQKLISVSSNLIATANNQLCMLIAVAKTRPPTMQSNTNLVRVVVVRNSCPLLDRGSFRVNNEHIVPIIDHRRRPNQRTGDCSVRSTVSVILWQGGVTNSKCTASKVVEDRVRWE